MSGRFRLGCVLAMAIGGLNCASQLTSPPPGNPTEYREMRALRRTSYPRQTVLLFNLQRVLDRDLEATSRAASMRVVADLGGEEPLVLEQLAGVLGDKGSPQALREEVLAFLLSKDYPELAPYVVKVLPQTTESQRLRSALLDWLARHPAPATLSEIVRAWAEAGLPEPDEENNFRQVVQRLSNKSWDRALLEAVNSTGFAARGSAIEVLVRRVPQASLKNAILELAPQTEAVTVLQAFITRFDYLPATGQELLSAASIHRPRGDVMPQAAELAARWRRQDGYMFNIRDFHLLSRLAADPRRSAITRVELVGDLARSLPRRRHARYHAVPAAQEDISTRFDVLADRLSMADLWNLRLLNDMLSRSQIQAAMAVMAEEDRADRRRAFGGLVFLEGGQAQAKLYPPDPQTPPDDLIYWPGGAALTDGRDALCRFQAHFETLHNANRAGPTPTELSISRRANCYLMVLTTLSDAAFCAHYSTPEGLVVSLGQLPLAR